jgi:hypothetical protein
MKKRKFADGGETTEMMPSAKPEGGRFDEDTYSRARRFVEGQGKKEETKTAVKKARKVEVDPTAGEAKEGKAAQRAADMMGDAETTAPAKRPGMMSRLRAMREKALKRMREETPDLSMRDESTSNPMGKNFGAGQVNPKTLMPYEKGGKVAKYASGGYSSSNFTYADPERYSETSASESAKAKALRRKIEDTPRPTMESSVDKAARDSRLNRLESEEEDTEQRVTDQYPSGTKRGSQTSRNTAKYGKPVKLPSEKKDGEVKKYAKGGSIDGCAQRGKTRGKMR